MEYRNDNPFTPKPDSIIKEQYGEMSTNAQLLRAILNTLAGGTPSGTASTDYEYIQAYLTATGQPIIVRASYDPLTNIMTFTDPFTGTVYTSADLTLVTAKSIFLGDEVIVVDNTIKTLTVPASATKGLIHIMNAAVAWTCGTLNVFSQSMSRCPNGGNITLVSFDELTNFKITRLGLVNATIYVQYFLGD